MSNTVNSDSVAQDQLRAFIERIERMEEEKKAIADDIKEIYGEAKGNGFDVKVLRQIVRIRKQDHNERMEQEALLDLYMAALGMQAAPREDDYDDEPRGRQYQAEAAGLRIESTTQGANVSAALSAETVGLSTTTIQQSPTAVTTEAEVASSSVAEIQPATVDDGLAEPACAHDDAAANIKSATIRPATASENAPEASTIQSNEGGSDEEASHRSVEPLRRRHDIDDPTGPAGDALHEVEGTTRPVNLAGEPVRSNAPATNSPAPEQPQQRAPRSADQIATDMGLPAEADPRCRKPGVCGRFSHVKLCLGCRVAAGLERATTGEDA